MTPVEINEIPMKVPCVHLFLSNVHMAQGVAEQVRIACHVPKNSGKFSS